MAGIEGARLIVRVGADVSGAMTGLNAVSVRLSSFAGQAASVGAVLTAGLSAPLALIGKSAIGMAADYETGMNLLQATTGASAEQMGQLSEKAKALGADMGLPATSAVDAGQAMLELAKAGLSVNDTLAASRGVLQLAAAGQLSNARAAEIAANALNAFKLPGSDATTVANLLAAAANASSAEVDGLADSLQMSSAILASAGVPIQDTVTQLGLLANAGIQGSDAGTSLKQMFLSLQAPSEKAKEILGDFGIEVYDANGAMKDARSLIEEFSAALGPLTQEERNFALAAVFGSDAVRAANIVLMGGTEAFDAMHEAVTKEGAAADLAGARMRGLGGAIEGFKSVVETALLDAVEPFLGTLAGFVKQAAGVVEGFAALDASTKNVVLAIGAALAVAGPLLLALAGLAAVAAALASPIGLVAVAFVAVAGAVASGLVPLQALHPAVAALAPLVQALWASLKNLAGVIAAEVGPLVGRLAPILGTVLVAAAQALLFALRVVVDALAQWIPVAVNAANGALDILQAAWSTVAGVFQGVAQAIGQIVAGDWLAAFQTMGQIVVDAWNNINTVFATAAKAIGRQMLALLDALMPTWETAWTTLVVTVRATAKAIFDEIKSIVRAVAVLAAGVGDVISKVLAGDWAGAWEAAKTLATETVAATVDSVGDSLGDIRALVSNAQRNIGVAWSQLWGNVAQEAITGTGIVATQTKAAAATFQTASVEIEQAVVGTVAPAFDLMGAMLTEFKDDVWTQSGMASDAVGEMTDSVASDLGGPFTEAFNGAAETAETASERIQESAEVAAGAVSAMFDPANWDPRMVSGDYGQGAGEGGGGIYPFNPKGAVGLPLGTASGGKQWEWAQIMTNARYEIQKANAELERGNLSEQRRQQLLEHIRGQKKVIAEIEAQIDGRISEANKTQNRFNDTASKTVALIYGVSEAFVEAESNASSLKDVVEDLADALDGLGGSGRGRGSSGAFSVPTTSRRQHGGPVSSGGMYLVGEAGPELLRMGSRGGEVIPLADGPGGGGGGVSAFFDFSGAVITDKAQFERSLLRMVEDASRSGALRLGAR